MVWTPHFFGLATPLSGPTFGRAHATPLPESHQQTHIWKSLQYQTYTKLKNKMRWCLIYHFTADSIVKLLQLMWRPTYTHPCTIVTALRSGISQSTNSGGTPSVQKNRCIDAIGCLLRAGQPTSGCDTVNLYQFLDELSCNVFVTMGVKGLEWDTISFLCF